MRRRHCGAGMRTLFSGEQFAIFDYRCTARCGERPFDEIHGWHSISYVRKGTFGYHTRGRTYDLVAGSMMLGRAGDEFRCSHEHMAGDECLAIMLEPEMAETLPPAAWRHGALPPLAELVVLGQLAEASASGATDIALDEAALLLVARTITLSADQPPAPVRVRERDRRRMIEAALWIESRCDETLGLEQAARIVDLSPYHFLRQFRAVVGVTPHQHLLRCRLRHAARLLAESELPVTDVALDVGFQDLSNFIRTFRRAAGVAPRDFRRGELRRSADPRSVIREA